MATDSTTSAPATKAKAAPKKAAPKKAAAKKPAAKKAAAKTTPLRERDLKVLTVEAGYAATGLADEAISFARELPAKADKLRVSLTEKVSADAVKTQVKELRSDAEGVLSVEKVKATVTDLRATVTKTTKDLGTQAKELRTEAPAKLKELKAETLVKDAKTNVENYRSKFTKELDGRVASFEKAFDTRVKAGKKVVTEVKANEQVKNVLGQAKNTSSKVKGAVTSVRKTADVAVEAGAKQAENAKSQVKAAATSAKKTVDTVVEAGKELAS